jgi:radical SAM protein (TIGR01212 family)
MEYGLQSAHDSTLIFINRGHMYADFEKAVLMTKKYNIKVTVHIILGLPYETMEMMLDTVKRIGTLPIDGIKFHHLHIIKGTKLEKMYLNKEVELLTEDRYIEILSHAIACLPENVIIARLLGDAPAELLVAPDWPLSKNDFICKLNTYMANNSLYQGKFS